MFTEIKTPVWSNPEHTAIDCEVNFIHLQQDFVPFTAAKEGDTDYGAAIFAKCEAGEFGVVAEYVPPVEPPKVRDEHITGEIPLVVL